MYVGIQSRMIVHRCVRIKCVASWPSRKKVFQSEVSEASGNFFEKKNGTFPQTFSTVKVKSIIILIEQFTSFQHFLGQNNNFQKVPAPPPRSESNGRPLIMNYENASSQCLKQILRRKGGDRTQTVEKPLYH